MAKSIDIPALFVKSGATEWDDAGRLQGQTDLPLSESGRSAFEASIDAMLSGEGAPPIGAVLHGPDEASVQTAQMLAGRASVRAKRVDGLKEMDLGLWEGLRGEELIERHPTAYKQWRDDPTSVTPPDGDTLSDAESRLLGALARALERPGRGAVAVVLRPISYGLALCWARGEPSSGVWRALDEAPPSERATVSRERLRELAEALRAGA